MKFLAGTTLAIYSLSSVSAQDANEPCSDLSTNANLVECVAALSQQLDRVQNGRFTSKIKSSMNKMIGEALDEKAVEMMEDVEELIADSSSNGPDMDVTGNVYISYGGGAGQGPEIDADGAEITEETETETEPEEQYNWNVLAEQEAGTRDYWDFDGFPPETTQQMMLARFFEWHECIGQIYKMIDADMYANYDFGDTISAEDLQFIIDTEHRGSTMGHDELMAHWQNVTQDLGEGWKLSNNAEFMAAYGDAWANDWIATNPVHGYKTTTQDWLRPALAAYEPFTQHSNYVYCIALPNMIRPNKFEHDPWHPNAFVGMDDYDLLDEIAHSRFWEHEQCLGQVWQLVSADMFSLFSLPEFDAAASTAIRDHWAEVLADKTELFGSWFADRDWIDFYNEHGRLWGNTYVQGILADPVNTMQMKPEYRQPMAMGMPYAMWMQFKYCQVLPNVLRVSNLKQGIQWSEGDYVIGQEAHHDIDAAMDFF